MRRLNGFRPASLAAALAVAAVTGIAGAAIAQPKPQPHAAGNPAPAPAPNAAPGAPAMPEWSSFPTMLLEKIYRGPLKDTIIQRWRDPIDGSVCYVYLPISAPLLPQGGDLYAQYGAAQIGSISCIHPTQVLQIWEGGKPPNVPPPATRR